MSRTGRPPESTFECPVCGSAVRAPVEREFEAAPSPVGPKSPTVERVVCPDCEATVDGFRPH